MKSSIPTELTSSTMFYIGILLIALSGVIRFTIGLESSGAVIADFLMSTTGVLFGGIALMRLPNGHRSWLFWAGLFAVFAVMYRILSLVWHVISRMA